MLPLGLAVRSKPPSREHGATRPQHRVSGCGRCTECHPARRMCTNGLKTRNSGFLGFGVLSPEKGGLLALNNHWIFLVLLNRFSPLCWHLPCGGGFSLFPFVLFMYFPSTSWSGVPPGDRGRRRVLDVIGVAGLPHTAVGAILISLDPPDKPLLFQHSDSLSRRIGRTSTTCRNGFHGRSTVPLLACATHQKAVDCKLDRCQVITKKCVAEFEKTFS